MPPRQRMAHIPKHGQEEYVPEATNTKYPTYIPKNLLKVIPAKPLKTTKNIDESNNYRTIFCGIPIEVALQRHFTESAVSPSLKAKKTIK